IGTHSQALTRLPRGALHNSAWTLLDRVAPKRGWRPAAKRNLSAAMQHLAAQVEVLVDDDHGCPEVPRTNGGWQPGAPASDDDHIGLEVPFNGVDGRNLR